MENQTKSHKKLNFPSARDLCMAGYEELECVEKHAF